jgi:hypothetical protein
MKLISTTLHVKCSVKHPHSINIDKLVGTGQEGHSLGWAGLKILGYRVKTGTCLN